MGVTACQDPHEAPGDARHPISDGRPRPRTPAPAALGPTPDGRPWYPPRTAAPGPAPRHRRTNHL